MVSRFVYLTHRSTVNETDFQILIVKIITKSLKYIRYYPEILSVSKTAELFSSTFTSVSVKVNCPFVFCLKNLHSYFSSDSSEFLTSLSGSVTWTFFLNCLSPEMRKQSVMAKIDSPSLFRSSYFRCKICLFTGATWKRQFSITWIITKWRIRNVLKQNYTKLVILH